MRLRSFSMNVSASDKCLRQSSTRPLASDSAARRGRCEVAASTSAQYSGYHAVGLEYGPAYRLLGQVWVHSGRAYASWHDNKESATAVLRSLARPYGVAMHPAELDGALQLSTALVPLGAGSKNETWVPFAVDDAVLSAGALELHAVSGLLVLHPPKCLPCRGS